MELTRINRVTIYIFDVALLLLVGVKNLEKLFVYIRMISKAMLKTS